jgi:hypothetical protein
MLSQAVLMEERIFKRLSDLDKFLIKLYEILEREKANITDFMTVGIKALSKAVELSTSKEFKKQRDKLYAWREDVINRGVSNADALEEMETMIKEYNECMKSSTRKFYIRLAFTIGGVALGLAAGTLANPWATASVFVSLATFLTLDRKPVIQAGDNEPAAVFHTINKKMGFSSG